MKVHVKAVVVYPIYINQELEVANPDDIESVREATLKEAAKAELPRPVIHDSDSHPDMIE